MRRLLYLLLTFAVVGTAPMAPLQGAASPLTQRSRWSRAAVALFALCVLRSSPQAYASSSTALGGVHNESGQGLACNSLSTCWGIGMTESFGAGDQDVLLLRYDSTFSFYTLGSSEADRGLAVTAGLQDTFFIGGDTQAHEAYPQPFLAKLEGTQLAWAKVVDNVNVSSSCTAVAPAPVEGCIAACYITDDTTNTTDPWLLYIDDQGQPLWSERIYTNGSARVNALLISPTHDIVTVGTMTNALGHDDLFVAQYNATGGWQWTRLITGTGDEQGHDLALTATGAYTVAGTTTSYGVGRQDILLARIDRYGTWAWINAFGGSHDDAAYTVVTDPAGGFTLCGRTSSYGSGHQDTLCADFDDAGMLRVPYVLGARYHDTLRAAALFGTTIVSLGDTTSYGVGQQDLLWITWTQGNHACSVLATPIVTNVPLSGATAYANFTQQPFPATLVDLPWQPNPIPLSATPICPATTTASPTPLPSQSPSHRPTTSPTPSPLTAAPTAADKKPNWTLIGVFIGVGAFVLSLSCWSAFWVTFIHEKKDIKEGIEVMTTEIQEQPKATKEKSVSLQDTNIIVL